ncbi:MAG: HlyU family transcriptional regulator [Alphaproteobacteria bacterium]|jgi:hypothetical protein|tara:strand:- start:7977 stop:8255 length:279 start_codon:yes stop_codon:yes gene_type:complete
MFNKIKTIISGSSSSPEIIYKDFTIIPKPRKVDGSWLTVGIIRKTIDNSIQEKEFIRTDNFASKHDASDCAARKAKIIIDEMGDKIFEVDWL